MQANRRYRERKEEGEGWREILREAVEGKIGGEKH